MFLKSLKYFSIVFSLFSLYLLSLGKGLNDFGFGLVDRITFVENEASEEEDFKYKVSEPTAYDAFTDLSSVVIDLISFNAELVYFPGGSISVLFEPKGVLPIDNVFQLELSDASGSFASPEVIAVANEFFTPILNGKIPPGTALGDGYKLRISYGPEQGPRSFTELEDTIEIGSIDTPFSIPFINIGSNAQGVNFRCLSDIKSALNPNYHLGRIEHSNSEMQINNKVSNSLKRVTKDEI